MPRSDRPHPRRIEVSGAQIARILGQSPCGPDARTLGRSSEHRTRETFEDNFQLLVFPLEAPASKIRIMHRTTHPPTWEMVVTPALSLARTRVLAQEGEASYLLNMSRM